VGTSSPVHYSSVMGLLNWHSTCKWNLYCNIRSCTTEAKLLVVYYVFIFLTRLYNDFYNVYILRYVPTYRHTYGSTNIPNIPCFNCRLHNYINARQFRKLFRVVDGKGQLMLQLWKWICVLPNRYTFQNLTCKFRKL